MDASALRIVSYPAPVLRVRAGDIGPPTEETRAVAARMIELMRRAEGIGLAAPQIGLSWRMFVVEIPAEEGRTVEGDPPTATGAARVFINPEITQAEGAPEPLEEGCLSLPEIRGDVLRPPIVTVRAMDEHGKAFTLRAGGLLARCVQHEMDHLDGVLIIDRFTQMSRMKTKSAVRELEKSAPQPAPADEEAPEETKRAPKKRARSRRA